jgi:phosphoribosylamine--glycine ligase
MTFLIIGSGGREHALAWKLGQEAAGRKIYVAPGNDGMSADPDIDAECVDISPDAFEELAHLAVRRDVDLTVVGPEGPLCDGIVDYFESRDLPIFGPSEAAARLEGSKSFANQLMEKAGVPTADFRVFDELDSARKFASSATHPLAIKADGLAGGKGVILSQDVEQSQEVLDEYMAEERFGEASARVVIEEYLEGEEMSFILVCDGRTAVPLATSRDHKRVGEGGEGPNTGGMGAVAPVPDVSPALEDEVVEEIVTPTLAELRDQGIHYRGFLYAGLMLTDQGPKVLEFNCRMGDPEAQPLLYALQANVGEAMTRAADGNLGNELDLKSDRHACCVVLASRGYPASERDTGHQIEGLDEVSDLQETKVFHAGTRREDGGFVNAGGRVLGVTGKGNSHEKARSRAYDAVSRLGWEGMYYRNDIGA